MNPLLQSYLQHLIFSSFHIPFNLISLPVKFMQIYPLPVCDMRIVEQWEPAADLLCVGGPWC